MVDYAAKYPTARERILGTMKDLEWHNWKELSQIGGIRHQARLRELKRLGYKFETKSDIKTGHGRRCRLLDTVPGRPEKKMVKIYLPESSAKLLLDDRVSEEAKKIIEAALRIFAANRHKL
jgi:hypothetical protein